jgi:hypothetical protein
MGASEFAPRCVEGSDETSTRAVWLLLSSAVSAGPIDRLALTASPVSSFAPANLVVRVDVTPDPRIERSR